MLNTTEVAPEQACASWDQYVLSHPGGSGYHLMAWRRVMEDAFGHATFYLMATDEDQTVRGVLPLVFFSNRLFGRLLVSMPFVNYGGLLADTVEAQSALLKAAVDLARSRGQRTSSCDNRRSWISDGLSSSTKCRCDWSYQSISRRCGKDSRLNCVARFGALRRPE